MICKSNVYDRILSSINSPCECYVQALKLADALLSVLLMSLIILHGSRLPVVRVMRIAGQYAKPRSKPTEIIELEVSDGVVDGENKTKKERREVMSFRGDNVNGYEATDRAPDPDRLLGYVHLFLYVPD